MYSKLSLSPVASAAMLAGLAIGAQAASATAEPCALLSQQVAAAATAQNGLYEPDDPERVGDQC